jgi:hypothetical protein
VMIVSVVMIVMIVMPVMTMMTVVILGDINGNISHVLSVWVGGRTFGSGGEGGGKLLVQIEPWYLGPVPTYRVNKHKYRRNIRHQIADSRQRSSWYRSIVYMFNVLVNLEFHACTCAPPRRNPYCKSKQDRGTSSNVQIQTNRNSKTIDITWRRGVGKNIYETG